MAGKKPIQLCYDFGKHLEETMKNVVLYSDVFNRVFFPLLLGKAKADSIRIFSKPLAE